MMAPLNLHFMALILSHNYPVANVIKVLNHYFGETVLLSECFAFNQTQYYESEMGGSLTRYFVAFADLKSPALLADMKDQAVEIEKKHFSKDGKRLVNLDPGYLDEVKIVLASTKPGGHKIALSPHIYADMILDYYKGQFRSFDWTFPDFKQGIYDGYFKRLRDYYMSALKV